MFVRAGTHAGEHLDVPLCKPARKEVMKMARNTRQTGTRAASAASKVLANPKSSQAAKSAAASALSQTPKRGR